MLEKIGLPKIGMRTFKTALAAFLCLLIYNGLNHLTSYIHFDSSPVWQVIGDFWNNSNAVIALIAAVIDMQGTLEGSVRYGLCRIAGTAVGGVTGVVFISICRIPGVGALNIIIVPVGIMFVIYICNLIRLTSPITIAVVAYLVIMMSFATTGDPYLYALNRWLDTVIGIAVSILVNRFVRRPGDSAAVAAESGNGEGESPT